jgi:secondary thiamine-phosphate synthase enzyme
VITFSELEMKTGGRHDAVDVTSDVEATVASAGVEIGSALIFSPHTTCCVLIARSAREAFRALSEASEVLAPEGAYYAHDDLDIRTENLVEDEPPNAPAHILHVFLGKASECIPISGGQLVLGADQRVFIVELDTSRLRRYCIQVIGE